MMKNRLTMLAKLTKAARLLFVVNPSDIALFWGEQKIHDALSQDMAHFVQRIKFGFAALRLDACRVTNTCKACWVIKQQRSAALTSVQREFTHIENREVKSSARLPTVSFAGVN